MWSRGGAPIKQFTTEQPGLAYAPFDFANFQEGRYYLIWVRRLNPEGKRQNQRITQTQGNDVSPCATSERLIWSQPSVEFTNDWSVGQRNVSLVYDRVGENVRAARTNACENPNDNCSKPGGLFYPFADGIINLAFKDHDDYEFMRKNLGCQLVCKRTPDCIVWECCVIGKPRKNCNGADESQ